MDIFIDNIFLGLPTVCKQRVKKPRLRIKFTTPEGITIGGYKMALSLTTTQKVIATIQPVDSMGMPAVVEGIPVWTSSNPEILTATASADGLSADLVTVGPLGDVQVSVSADADFGDGVNTLTATTDITVQPEEAVSLGISLGTPVPK